MFIALDGGESVDTRSVIGVFDLETAGRSDVTKEFLKNAENSFELCNPCSGIPNSFIITSTALSDGVVLSSHSVSSLKKRFTEGF